MAAKLRMKIANGREYARMNTNNRAVEPQIDQASLKEEMGARLEAASLTSWRSEGSLAPPNFRLQWFRRYSSLPAPYPVECSPAVYAQALTRFHRERK